MEASSVRKREPLTPGQRRKRLRRILISLGLLVALTLIVWLGGNYLWNYYLQPRASQKEAYERAQLALEGNDAAAAIEALAHAGEREALGSFFLSPRGGLAQYQGADDQRLALQLELLQSAAVGDVVYWGRYEQNTNPLDGREAIAWRVVAREGNALTLISLYGLDCKPFQNTHLPVSWATCTLREWLNEAFYQAAFLGSERLMMAQHENADEANPVFGTTGGKTVRDMVYVPSISEALAWFSSDADRITRSTAYAKAWGANYREETCWYWLRNPGDNEFRKAIVHNDGSIYYEGYMVTLSTTATIRPVVNVDLSGKVKG